MQVESAGTAELGPVPPTADAIRVAREHDVDVAQHSARTLGNVDASAFDAIIGFERNHVAAAVVEAGASYERAFLLPELARLLSETDLPSDEPDPVERARAAIAKAHETRGQFVPGEEVDDPIGRPLRKYQEVFSDIHEMNARIVGALFPVAEAPRVREYGVPGGATSPEAPVVDRVWGSSEAPLEVDAATDRVWGATAAANASTAGVEEPVGEAEPAAHESPIPEATST